MAKSVPSPRIEIAPKFCCHDWAVLKQKLSGDGRWESFQTAWSEAICVLNSRIQKRFLDGVDSLISLPYAGFATLALDCLLIEAIQAFQQGFYSKTPTESRKAYKAILRTSPYFSKFFPSDQCADDFYTYVRNGLLHDGETRGGYLVKVVGPLLEARDDGSIRVNRKAFHVALCREFGDYIGRLSSPTEKQLRMNLVSAIEGLCERSRADWKK
jgi:hypothetical protein